VKDEFKTFEFKTFPIEPYYDSMHAFDQALVYEVDPEYVVDKIVKTQIKNGKKKEAIQTAYQTVGDWYTSTKKEYNQCVKDAGSQKKIANKNRREKNGENTNTRKK
jgi:hypothetical protein